MLNISIENFANVFDGSWGSAGPEILTRVLRHLCKFQPDEKFFDANIHTRERCDGVQVRNHRALYTNRKNFLH